MQTVKTALALVLLSLSMNGCALFRHKETTSLRIHEQVGGGVPPDRVLTVRIPLADIEVNVSSFPLLSENNVLSASLYETASGKAIFVRFDIHGAVVLDEATTRNRGKYLVTFLDKRPVAAWLVNQRILNGQFLIEGDFTDEEAQKAVDDLNQTGKKNRR